MSDKSGVQLITKLITLYLEDRITADQEDKLYQMFFRRNCVNTRLVEQARAGTEHGHPLYQALFGQMQLYGWGVAGDLNKAARLFRLSHEQGCNKGTCRYSWCLLFGRGVEPNPEEGVRLLLAHIHPEGRGDARLIRQLAVCYWDGWGVEQNAEKAARLYLEAAYLGYSQAMYMSGRCFLWGSGVKLDMVKAARWFRRASALGHRGARDGYLEAIQEKDAEAVNPYGEWEPTKEVHQWISKKVHQEMITALMVCKQRGIPNVVAVHCLLPFICSLPH